MTQYRDQVLATLRSELFGPARGENEIVVGRPYWRYLCGMLFPLDISSESIDEDDEKDAQFMGGDDDQADAAVALAYDALPSSMGISFYISGVRILRCEVEGARYERGDEDSTKWRRISLSSSTTPVVVNLEVPPAGTTITLDEPLWENRAKINAVFRPRLDGHLVTVTLVNTQRASGRGAGSQVEQMLFQCRFGVTVEQGAIGEYPSPTRYANHPEDDELALAYRHRRAYAVGHGCSAVWDADRSPVIHVQAEPMPVVEVRGLTTEIKMSPTAERALDIQWLANPDTDRTLIKAAFEAMVQEYRLWIQGQQTLVQSIPDEREATAQRMIDRQHQAVRRMESGVQTLFGEDPDVFSAFRIAQEAMLTQFMWSSHRGGPCDVAEAAIDPIELWSTNVDAPRWRPFQLAFQLVVLDSLARPESAERNVLDLLWFPTGGGKTEAYLALAAFEIALRRIRYGEAGGGTAVMMRYTLRLLTTQQFERAATLISAMETMRRSQPSLNLGDEPIRLGLWVGSATTPNALDRDLDTAPGARQVLEQIIHDEAPENPFQLRTCPRCSTRIIPRHRSPEIDHYGVRVTATRFRMFCPDQRCVLHDEIPVSVIDEDLFAHPPTFLIGTIDKFARMTWSAESHVFFGEGNRLPPSLIIQDELHLITGPLGTIAGVYEAAIDTVLRYRGLPPKYIAATATIQRAQEQSESLYARDVAVFPPPGLSAADSFFSREDTESPGRTFVGLMGHGMYSSLTSLIQASAAAAVAAAGIPKTAERARDTYWTQVIYHNSRQELGKTTTTLRDDVGLRLAILQEDEAERREFDTVEELSANLKGAQVSEALERLQISWPDKGVIDAVACTNMISVGVDVPRLGLMIVKSQPKSTSEYIQATSRIGRDRHRSPGIVLAVYAATRPRDRSHYETFQSYHSTLYRAVEPATVTPYSPPARERALHAGLVLALRQALAWIEPRSAGRFDPAEPDQAQILRLLRDRLLMACRNDERDEVTRHLDEIVSEWKGFVSEPGPPVSFSNERQFRALLAQFPNDGEVANGLWPTLNSMRHVDGEVEFRVRGELS